MVVDKLKYYKNQDKINSVILNDAKEDSHIIYGAKAINAQLPPYLNRHTDDWDIFSNTPKTDAIETEKKLDKEFGGDFFKVQKAEHPNTWKVKSNVTNKTVADYTYPNEKVPYTRIYANKYAKIGWIKSKIIKNLKSGSSLKFGRFDKDKEALQRIKLYEKEGDFLFG